MGSATRDTINLMTSTPAATPQTLAVCSSTSPVVIWHVELSPSFAGERLSGAWLVGPLDDGALETATNLLTGCFVALVTGEEGGEGAELLSQAIEQAGATVVDLSASVAGIREHIGQLRAAAKEEKAKPGKGNLTEPRFPKVNDVEVIDFPHVGEEVAGPVLGLARGVEELVAQWMAVESQRLRRKYLAEPWGAEPRQIPLVKTPAL
ncbi:hypothetical protein [uncultured Corynebacterium sp.]|uniref:hypothetical protein n=1 Tax=uncultured Corynebacterium sp. TaxID=159447 RepID=UPI002612B45F|nr:hypothetical protein [uncultured Corynebacterium sp.]